MAILLFESTNEYSNCFVLHVDILHSNRLRSRGRVIRLGPRSQVSNRISTCSPRPPETPKLHLIGPTSLQLRFLCINFQNFSYSFKVTHLAWSCVKSMHSSCTKTVSNQSGFCRGLSTHSPVSCRANVKRVWNGHRKNRLVGKKTVQHPFNGHAVMPSRVPAGITWLVEGGDARQRRLVRCFPSMSRHVESLSFKMYRHVKSKSASFCFFLFVLYGFGYLDVLTARRFQLSSLMFIVHLLSQHFLFNFFPGSPSMKGASPKSRPRWIIRTANAFPHGLPKKTWKRVFQHPASNFICFVAVAG